MKQISHKSYLERIRFDPTLNAGFVARYISNIRIVILLIVTIGFLGIISYLHLPQRLNPEIKIPIVMVSTILPGAGPEDVESLVTIPLEDKLRGLKGLDTITSVSQENFSIISLQFFNSTSQDEAKTLAKDAVESVSGLPSDGQEPHVDVLDFENQPIWQFAVTTAHDLPSLFTFADQLQEAIEKIPSVDKVVVHGREKQEIAVEVSPEKLTRFGISPLLLSQLLKSGIGAYPAGSVETNRNTYAITIDSSITSVDDIRNILLTVGGSTVKLGDIASVSERASANQHVSFVASSTEDPKRSVTFAVYKRSNADIVKTANLVHKEVDKTIDATNGRFTLIDISNAGELIRDQFLDLLGEFRSTMILVFGCLFLFLGLRQALISSVTVPLTFLCAFIFMQVFGMSINFLSLFAFLLALGLLVDDTIVVVSAMTTYFKTKKFTPKETGLLVWRDTIVPIWSTTITTIWSFVPLLLSAGIIGEFIKPIPVVVTVTMISSTAIAVLITLPVMMVLLKPEIAKRIVVFGKITAGITVTIMFFAFFASNPLFFFIALAYIIGALVFWRVRSKLFALFQHKVKRLTKLKKTIAIVSRYAQHGVISVDGFSHWYEKRITKVLESKRARRNVLVAIISYSVFAFMLLPLGLVQNEFFPKSDTDQVYVNLELPSGTRLTETRKESLDLLAKYRKTPGISYVVSETGSSIRNSFSGGSEQENIALFTFHLPKKEARSISSIEIAEDLRRNAKNYAKGKLSVVEQSGGPPAGADVQISLSGDSLAKLNQYADTIASYLQKQSGVVNIEKSIKPGTSAVVFIPDTDLLYERGLNTQSLGLWLRTFASGFTLGEASFDGTTDDTKNVVFTLGNTKQTPESLGRLEIPTPQGSVPLLSLGTFQTKSNPTQITRENGKRTISISAGVARGYQATKINSDLLVYAKTIPLPAGYEWKTGGMNEENQKSVESILQAMIVAAILILITMVVQFQSFRQAIIVLLVIPLAVSSVFLIFALTGTPLSFPALIGVLSLFGIVVTNSMFIVDKINLNLKEGMPYVKAIADAGASRMEPIILTKLCTVLGLLPITIADPLWRGLGGAIISGLLLASTIMLLFIPVVYYSWMKPEKLGR